MFKGTVKEKWADLKHSSRFTGLVLALLGAIKLLNDLGKPRVEALHGSDVGGLGPRAYQNPVFRSIPNTLHPLIAFSAPPCVSWPCSKTIPFSVTRKGRVGSGCFDRRSRAAFRRKKWFHPRSNLMM